MEKPNHAQEQDRGPGARKDGLEKRLDANAELQTEADEKQANVEHALMQRRLIKAVEGQDPARPAHPDPTKPAVTADS